MDTKTADRIEAAIVDPRCETTVRERLRILYEVIAAEADHALDKGDIHSEGTLRGLEQVYDARCVDEHAKDSLHSFVAGYIAGRNAWPRKA